MCYNLGVPYAAAATTATKARTDTATVATAVQRGQHFGTCRVHVFLHLRRLHLGQPARWGITPCADSKISSSKERERDGGRDAEHYWSYTATDSAPAFLLLTSPWLGRCLSLQYLRFTDHTSTNRMRFHTSTNRMRFHTSTNRMRLQLILLLVLLLPLTGPSSRYFHSRLRFYHKYEY